MNADGTRSSRGRAARIGGAAVLGVLTVLGTASAASAHVTVTPSDTAAGSYAVVELSVPHGCDGSATTAVTIQIPDSVISVTPTRNALWQVEKETVRLDPPLTDAHGNQITERVGVVTYTTDTPLPDGYRDTFALSLQIPDEVGETLAFPTIQTCERGEVAWIEVPETGGSAEALELPAPSFVVTAAAAQEPAEEVGSSDEVAAGTGSTDDTTDTTVPTAEAAGRSEQSTSSSGSDALTIGALAVGALGVVLGGAALALGRRRA